MSPTAFVSHHDCSRHDTGWSHPEHQGRLPAVVRAVYRDMLTLHGHLREIEAVPASEEALLRVHDAAYLEALRGAVDRAEARGEPVAFSGEARVSSASWDAVRAASGCAIRAVDAVLAGEVVNAFCATRPPGRDASPGAAGMHSLVNHAAVAAAHARAAWGILRVLVIDLGARAPLGTPAAIAELPGVRLLSVHGAAPVLDASEGAQGAAVRFRAVPVGSAGGALHLALMEELDGMASEPRPELVVLSLGLEVLAGDPLGGLAVDPAEVHEITADLRRWVALHSGGRLVSLLEGGYAPAALGRAVVQHLRALADLPPA